MPNVRKSLPSRAHLSSPGCVTRYDRRYTARRSWTDFHCSGIQSLACNSHHRQWETRVVKITLAPAKLRHVPCRVAECDDKEPARRAYSTVFGSAPEDIRGRLIALVQDSAARSMRAVVLEKLDWTGLGLNVNGGSMEVSRSYARSGVGYRRTVRGWVEARWTGSRGETVRDVECV
ncbi:hypothetical protein BDW22DRAFT_1356743 [Trametopsis cervina]|nr:hypothetical protein BDW22DRAFT_1356743 [Trametopsis cervina]